MFLSIPLFSTYVPTVLLSVIFLSIFVLYYVYMIKPYSSFVICHLNLNLVQEFLTRRKGIPLKIYMFRKVVDACKKYMNEGAIVCLLNTPYVFVFGEEMAKIIQKEPAATEKPKSYKLYEIMVGNGLFTSNGEDFKKQKKILNPALHGQSLKSKTSIMNEKAREIIPRLNATKGSPTDNVLHFIKLSTLRIFFEATLGIKPEEFDSDRDSENFLKQLNSVMEFTSERLYIPWYQWNFLLNCFPKSRKVMKINKEMKESSMKVLEKLKACLESQDENHISNGQVPDNIQNFLVRKKYIGQTLIKDPTFTLDDVYYQFITLTVGGFNTTANTTMWTLFMLGHHPDIQERVYEEILSETSDEVKYEDLRNLEYLERVIKETLRIYTVAPIYGRHLKKELQCGKFKIPKDSTVIIFMYMIHRNPDIFPDPEKFDPERFRDPNVLEKPWSYVPFAESVRPCVGKNYAMVQTKILLCHVLRNFRVASIDRQEDIDKHLYWSTLLMSMKFPRMQFLPR